MLRAVTKIRIGSSVRIRIAGIIEITGIIKKIIMTKEIETTGKAAIGETAGAITVSGAILTAELHMDITDIVREIMAGIGETVSTGAGTIAAIY